MSPKIARLIRCPHYVLFKQVLLCQMTVASKSVKKTGLYRQTTVKGGEDCKEKCTHEALEFLNDINIHELHVLAVPRT